MNTKRLVFWACFVFVLGLIVWGMVVAMNKPVQTGPKLGDPAPITAADHVTGPADAPVTIIEYSDFQCPACEMYYPIVEQLLASSSVPLRLVYRHFPLPQHANARLAAYASEAAAMQGRFWEMYRLIFANHADWTELADPHAVFEGYAAKLGLDAAKFKADIDSAEAKKAVDQDLAEGESLGINATPTFFVNGQAVTNPQGYEPFKAIIDAAARARD